MAYVRDEVIWVETVRGNDRVKETEGDLPSDGNTGLAIIFDGTKALTVATTTIRTRLDKKIGNEKEFCVK